MAEDQKNDDQSFKSIDDLLDETRSETSKRHKEANEGSEQEAAEPELPGEKPTMIYEKEDPGVKPILDTKTIRFRPEVHEKKNKKSPKAKLEFPDE